VKSGDTGQIKARCWGIHLAFDWHFARKKLKPWASNNWPLSLSLYGVTLDAIQYIIKECFEIYIYMRFLEIVYEGLRVRMTF